MKSKNCAALVLKRGREKSVLKGHPWVFSGSVQRVENDPEAGDLIEVRDGKGETLGFGFYNLASNIRLRMWSRLPAEVEDFDKSLSGRIKRAVDFRKRELADLETDSFRLINSEGDFISGLIVDYFAGRLVIQPLALWVEKHLDTVVDALKQSLAPELSCRSIKVLVEQDVARLEKMQLESHVVFGEESDFEQDMEIRENGIRYSVNLSSGQKTGFFFDQRENRLLLREVAQGKRVLDLFSYNGGFTLNAMESEAAQTVSVDSSEPALESLKKNIELNEFSLPHELRCENVKKHLPQMEEAGERFDIVICDPPPFARRKDHINSASRVYKDINRRCMKLIDDGLLFTFSCSPHIDSRLFRQIIFAAALESGRQVQVLRQLGPGIDHPVDVRHLEGEYLSGLLLRVVAVS